MGIEEPNASRGPLQGPGALGQVHGVGVLVGVMYGLTPGKLL